MKQQQFKNINLTKQERNKDKEMLSKSKERTKILEELKERFNQLTWGF